MPNPTRYSLSYDFTAFQGSNLSSPLPADKLEVEFNNLQVTTDQIITNLGLIQSSSGALLDGVVSYASLDASLKATLGDASTSFSNAAQSATAAASSATGAATSASSAAASASAAADDAADAASDAAAALVSANAAQSAAASVSLIQDKTAAETISEFEVCYINGSGTLNLADASAVATAKGPLRLANEAIASAATGEVLLPNTVKVTTGLTAGAVYFLSETAGAITATAPSTSGSVVRIVGHAESTTEFHFYPDGTYLEIP
jgi:hypothetical protein